MSMKRTRILDDAHDRHGSVPIGYDVVTPPTPPPTPAPTHTPTTAPTLAPTLAPSLTPVCTTDASGDFGDTNGPDVTSSQLLYSYEIETKGSQDGSLLIDKVENTISSKLLSGFFDSCAFRQDRRLEGTSLGVVGFSEAPKDVLNSESCRETPTNGNSCTSVVGGSTFFVEGEVDFDGIKSIAEEALMYSMANDEFIHIDESIVKISYIPYTAPVAVKVVNAPNSGGFNNSYLAFIPAGLICFIILFFVIKRRNQTLQSDRIELGAEEVDWRDAKFEPISSQADSVRSEVVPYLEPGDTSSDVSSLDDGEIFLQRTLTSNGFEVKLKKIEHDDFEEQP